MLLLVPHDAPGRRVDPNWDVLGMRATRSDSLILDECFVPDSAVMFHADDVRPFRQAFPQLVPGIYRRGFISASRWPPIGRWSG